MVIEASSVILLLLGAPGAGKGTQAKILKEQLKVAHLSTGDMLRDAERNQTELGKRAKEYMKKGVLVPDELVLGLIGERIQADDCKKGFILDGFPRNRSQADALEVILQKHGKSLQHVIAIDLPRDELIKRVIGRRSCESCGAGYHVDFQPPKVEGKCDKCCGSLTQRKDDNREVVVDRLAVYDRDTFPLLEYYKNKGLLHIVDGNGDMKSITSKILEILSVEP